MRALADLHGTYRRLAAVHLPGLRGLHAVPAHRPTRAPARPTRQDLRARWSLFRDPGRVCRPIGAPEMTTSMALATAQWLTLTATLTALAQAGRRVQMPRSLLRCLDLRGRRHPQEAADACRHCPALALCTAYAGRRPETWHVWHGATVRRARGHKGRNLIHAATATPDRSTTTTPEPPGSSTSPVSAPAHRPSRQRRADGRPTACVPNTAQPPAT